MALLADDAADRAEQLLLLTDRLTAIVDAETEALAAGRPARADAPESLELQRLANAYRLEMARIKTDPDLLVGAPEDARDRLRAATTTLHGRLDAYALALGAAREVTEGLVRVMAEETMRVRNGAPGYGAHGRYAEPPQTGSVALDRRA